MQRILELAQFTPLLGILILSNLTLGSFLAFSTSQGLGARRQRPKPPRLGGSQALPYGHGSINHFSDRVTHEVWRKKTNSSVASRGSGAPGPAHQPLEPASFTTKKPLESAHGGVWSKPTQPDTQFVRTEQSDDVQIFFVSMTSPRSTRCRCKTLLDSGACRP